MFAVPDPKLSLCHIKSWQKLICMYIMVLIIFILAASSLLFLINPAVALTRDIIEQNYRLDQEFGSWALYRSVSNAKDCAAVLEPRRRSDDGINIAIALHSAEKNSTKEGPILTILVNRTATMYSVLSANERHSVEKGSQIAPNEFYTGIIQKHLRDARSFFVTLLVPEREQFFSALFSPRGFKKMLSNMAKDCYIHLDEIVSDSPKYKNEEQKLRLRLAEKSKIHFILHNLYGDDRLAPPHKVTWPPKGDFRRYLVRFSRENGMPITSYVSNVTARALLARRLEVPEPDQWGLENQSVHRDWRSYRGRSSTGTACILETDAASRKGPVAWQDPTIQIITTNAGGASDLAIVLANRNPFSREAPAMVEVDGEHWFTLTSAGNRLKRSYNKASLIKAMQRGRVITVMGREAATGLPLEFTYSAMGFTAGFSRLASLCNAPGIAAILD